MARAKRAWVFQYKWQVEKMGSDFASWYVGFFDSMGIRKQQLFGGGIEGLEKAEYFKDKLNEKFADEHLGHSLQKHAARRQQFWPELLREYRPDVPCTQDGCCVYFGMYSMEVDGKEWLEVGYIGSTKTAFKFRFAKGKHAVFDRHKPAHILFVDGFTEDGSRSFESYLIRISCPQYNAAGGSVRTLDEHRYEAHHLLPRETLYGLLKWLEKTCRKGLELDVARESREAWMVNDAALRHRLGMTYSITG